MLFWIALAVIPALLAFASISWWYRGKIGDAVGFGFLGVVLAILVFGLVVPAIATGISPEQETRYSTPVSEIKTHQEDGSTVYTYLLPGDRFGSTSAYDDKINGTNKQSYVEKVCGVTPGWAFPFHDWYPECTETLYLGKADR